MTFKTTAIVGMAMILVATISTAEARRACDGFNGCRCGVTAARHNGLPLNYNGHNLKQAVGYIRAFPHTSFGVGAIGYVRHGGPTGHVFSVVGGSECSHATVYDDRGTYTRNVCGATFVSPRGMAVLTDMPRARHKSKHAGRIQVASYPATDRHSTQ